MAWPRANKRPLRRSPLSGNRPLSGNCPCPATAVLLLLSHETVHVPVLAEEVRQALALAPGLTVIDATLGGAGHFRQMIRDLWPQGGDANSRLLGIDRDAGAVEQAKQRLAEEGLLDSRPIELLQANYRDLPEVLDSLGIDKADRVLLDLGLSSDQLADSARGFSFHAEGPLDLRFDTSHGQPAWQWLQRVDAETLANAIYQFGEERFSRRIARALVEARRRGPLTSAREVAEIVRRAVPGGVRRGARIDPATRTFQALRIAVNEELDALDEALREIPDRLRPGGRLAIISFHSLEDRRVKEAFRSDPRLRPLTKKPLRPSPEEIETNPRSRSSRLRVAERLDTG